MKIKKSFDLIQPSPPQRSYNCWFIAYNQKTKLTFNSGSYSIQSET